MSRARLVITAVVLEGRSQSDVARTYGVSQSWVSELVARYKEEGEAAFEPRSRRPVASPRSTPSDVVDEVVAMRRDLERRGLDAGPSTIVWHLAQGDGLRVSRATVARILVREELVIPSPKKRPKSSYVRFEADQPNECWQADFTHYWLTVRDGREREVEILTFLDDHSRLILECSCHRRGHRADRARGLPKSRAAPRDPGLNAHRQRHGLHDATGRRQRWSQRL
jgi:transposase